jgi:glycosyltransferase involved in cell wall biosynthesis
MISFVVPAYNEEALIAHCIRSIQRAAGNIRHEIIVVDNASTDRTGEIAWAASAKVVPEPTKGITWARQAGADLARYDLIAFIDADSELPAGWLDAALSAIQQPGVVAVSGPIVYDELSLAKRIIGFAFYCVAKAAHLIWPMLQGGNFLLRKEALRRAGGFNTAIDFYGEDTDTAVRLSAIGKVKFDLGMWIYSSARRMQEEGMARTGGRYIINYLWIWLFGRPWSAGHHDHRPH